VQQQEVPWVQGHRVLARVLTAPVPWQHWLVAAAVAWQQG
jgi:hypothetical protein